MGGDRRHIGRADIVDGVECVGTFACIERCVHPLFCGLGGSSRICIGSSRYSGVIQIEIFDTRLLLHVDAEAGVEPIACEALV